ncbi:hypothetical protein [Allocoleopsis sp.]|uniref:hypothetical protein n=1 Tax=Allocoleopsis sp. TaxID=3088169 RepID=UPI002FD6D05B
MSGQPMQYKNCEDALNSIQGELLEALLHSEEDFYPWNPAEPEAEAYFAELEREFLLEQWQEVEEITQASQTLFNQLHQCWSSSNLVVEEKLRQSLSDRFATLMPEAWLEAIAHKAQQIFSTNMSLAEQLVLCVKPLLPNWAEDDLLVFARPLAYAMRGKAESGAETPSGVARSVEWTELSPMEQARLSLTVAHSALLQLQNSSDNAEQP